ncbi:hypothetical protein ABG79_02467 [Caloramator mitchellensis]|uniref:Transposase n=1 Tax=Caloramator mitchellensis TaxID=908809 RepID=A0A0R3JZ28_CALMK|nr:hypothetical protein ABG79_02467 [Caloramator mitchellensis]
MQKGKIEVAERMLRKGLDVSTVAELSDLSIEEVENIKKNLIH